MVKGVIPEVKVFLIVFVFGLAGLVNSAIFYVLYERGIMIDEFIVGSITIGELMTVILIPWILCGIIVALLMAMK